MSTLITLSSEKAIAKNPSNNSSNFTFTYPSRINLGSLNYEVALLSAELWYSVRNVTGNKVIRYTHDNEATWVDLAVPDGVYTVLDLNKLLHSSLEDEGVVDTDMLYGLSITVNYNTNRCGIVIDNTVDGGTHTFKLDLTASNNLASLLGFDEAVYDTTTTGQNTPDVAAQDAWQIRCDLINKSYDGDVRGDVIYSFTPQSPPNSNMRVEPLHLTYVQVKKSEIDSITIRFTDQNNKDLDFGGEDTIVSLSLRPIKN